MTKTALLALGCPEFPVQTSTAIYLAYQLQKHGITPVFAGNKSALLLVKVADPERHYCNGKMMNLDMTIGALSTRNIDFDFCFVFVHSDSGIAYLASIHALSKGKMVAVVFGKCAEELTEQCKNICEHVLAAPVIHNPLPLKELIDEVSTWLHV